MATLECVLVAPVAGSARAARDAALETGLRVVVPPGGVRAATELAVEGADALVMLSRDPFRHGGVPGWRCAVYAAADMGLPTLDIRLESCSEPAARIVAFVRRMRAVLGRPVRLAVSGAPEAVQRGIVRAVRPAWRAAFRRLARDGVTAPGAPVRARAPMRRGLGAAERPTVVDDARFASHAPRRMRAYAGIAGVGVVR